MIGLYKAKRIDNPLKWITGFIECDGYISDNKDELKYFIKPFKQVRKIVLVEDRVEVSPRTICSPTGVIAVWEYDDGEIVEQEIWNNDILELEDGTIGNVACIAGCYFFVDDDDEDIFALSELCDIDDDDDDFDIEAPDLLMTANDIVSNSICTIHCKVLGNNYD